MRWFKSPITIIKKPDIVFGRRIYPGDLQIEGTVEGDVLADAILIAETGRVTGSVGAAQVRIAGTLKGDVFAERVVCAPSARVNATISHRNIKVERGAKLYGALSCTAMSYAVWKALAERPESGFVRVDLEEERKKSEREIFISYAKEDRALTEALAAKLAAKGHRVWFDADLSPGQNFPALIMGKIDNSKAAIVIWTRTSVGKQWVYAEAERAHKLGKLIPVKVNSLDYHSIPLPFGTLQTCSVNDLPAIEIALGRVQS